MKKRCLICMIPADMDNPVVGWLLYRHVNRVACREQMKNREEGSRLRGDPEPSGHDD